MGFESVLSMARRLVAERLRPGGGDSRGGPAVDATAGGGVDTLFLARTVGPGGCVYAFDVQEAALARTRERLAQHNADAGLARVELLLAGHERMLELAPAEAHGRVQAVMFNLGYLPGGDTAVITKPGTTLAAMEAALALLAPGGVLTAVLYPGHAGGDAEAQAVSAWAAGIPSAIAQAMQYRFVQKPHAPYLLALVKRQEEDH